MNYNPSPTLLPSGELEFAFSKRRSFRIQPWSEGFGMYTVHGDKYMPGCQPTLALIAADTEIENKPDLCRFVMEIPEAVRHAVQPFHGFGQLWLIQWTARHEAAIDLLLSNPNLLWLLAFGLYEGKINKTEIPFLLREKQRTILGKLLGRAVSGSQLKLLRKIVLERGCLAEARVIQPVLADPGAATLLRHQNPVPVALIHLLYRYPAIAQTALLPLLTRCAAHARFDDLTAGYEIDNTPLKQIAELCEDTVRLGEALQAGPALENIRRYHSSRQIQQLHDRWQARMAVKQSGSDMHPAFPRPPLPDDTGICAIRSKNELVKESRIMSHCVKTYAHAVEQGESYFYRVSKPQRATLEIKRLRDGTLTLGQLKLTHNQLPSHETCKFVRNWFDRHYPANKERWNQI